MSRNLRHKKNPPAVAKKSIKKPLTSDSSSDDDYAGVDLISDADDEEPDVEVAEEQAIVDSEENDDSVLQPDIDDDQSCWAGFDVENEIAFGCDNSLFDGHMSRNITPNVYAEATAWEASIGRRVRFDLSDSDSSDTEVNIFPDIFLDQNSLDPQFRQTIENDHNNDNDDPPSDVGSYWDFRGDEVDVTENADVDDDDDSDGSTGSSGYETDEGETTEEDLPPAAQYVPARSILRRQSTESSSSEEDIAVIRRNPYRPPTRSGPRLGSWVTDASKPFAVIDSHGKKLVMFKARTSRRYSFNGDASRPMQNLLGENENDTTPDQSLMISSAANMMLTAMITPLDALFGGHAVGPPEAFYPFVSIAANGAITQDSSSFDEDDIDDDDVWDIGDLIDFGDDTSDDEGLVEEGDSSASPIDLSSGPLRPTTASSEEQIHPLLNHLDRGVVGAFRRNQNRHQLLTRNVASRESLTFSGPYHQGTLRGIKGGRLAAANTPITPPRKTRNVKADIILSPLLMDPVAVDMKRKFSGEQHQGHKRTRSMF